jgi:hypothetical protein
MRRGIKKKEGENLTSANIKKVIQLLTQENPITKREACDTLNISYNTTRLTRIIEEYQADVEYRKTRMAQKRGRPATKDEIADISESYLGGESLSDIGKRVYRSVAFVKNIIEKVGIPNRAVGEEKAEIEYLPEECVAEEFEIGEIAWSAKYHTSCEIRAKLEDRYMDKYNTPCYRVWIREPTDSMQDFGGFNAYIPAYDLGKLEHLKEYGLNTKLI